MAEGWSPIPGRGLTRRLEEAKGGGKPVPTCRAPGAFVATHRHRGVCCHPPTPGRLVPPTDCGRRIPGETVPPTNTGAIGATMPRVATWGEGGASMRAEGTPGQRPGLQPRKSEKTVCVLKGRRGISHYGTNASRPIRSSCVQEEEPRPAHLGGIRTAGGSGVPSGRVRGGPFPGSRGWKPRALVGGPFRATLAT